MHQPDTIGRERCAQGHVMGMLVRGVGFEGVDVAMSRYAVVAVRVGVEVPAPQAREQPCSEEDYDDTDQSLRSLLHRPRQVTSQQHERKADENQRRAVPHPPGKTHRAGLSRPSTLLFGGNEGGNRCQVVGVGGVPQTQRQAYEKYYPESRRPVQEGLEPTVYRRHTLSLHQDRLPLASLCHPATRIRLGRKPGSQRLQNSVSASQRWLANAMAKVSRGCKQVQSIYPLLERLCWMEGGCVVGLRPIPVRVARRVGAAYRADRGCPSSQRPYLLPRNGRCRCR